MFMVLVKTSRPPFLILTPVTIFLGYALAKMTSVDIGSLDLLLTFAGALSAHISVNAFNEYFDFHSGLDSITKKTPFSGGSGALNSAPEYAGAVYKMAMVSLLITILVGLYFLTTKGLLLLPIGIAGVLIIISYTQWINRHAFICLLAPGLAYGPLIIVGTHFVLTGLVTISSFFISLIPFFLINNLLLLNQFPDREADKQSGRLHYPVTIGLKKSTMIYGFFVLLASVIIIVNTELGYLPPSGLAVLMPVGAGMIVFVGALRYAETTDKLIPYMVLNVIVAIMTPLMLGLVLLLS